MWAASRAVRAAALCLAALAIADAAAAVAAVAPGPGPVGSSCSADTTRTCASDGSSVQKTAPVLVQTRASLLETGSVLYMVKSYKGFYETKLRALLKTWGSTVSKSSFLVLGDEEWSEFPVHRAPMCGSDATDGLSCRVAYGFTLAAKHPGNWSWLYVIDDDHYVRTASVQKALAKFDASKPVGAGCYGCGSPQFCDGAGGFCGGCGYIFSRAAVVTMVGGNATEFMAAHNEISRSKKAEGREDMAISCAMRDRVPNLEIQQMATMHGDAPNVEGLRRGAEPDSLSWHHITAEQMVEIHSALEGVQ